MKKLLIILFAIALSTNLSVASEKTVGATLDISITFGRRSLGCEGKGICKFTIIVEKTIGDNTVNAICTFNEKTKTLEIKINKENGILDETVEKYFANNSFKVEEDFELSNEVLTLLEMENDFVIRKGFYKIIDAGDYYQLNFK